MNDTVRIVLSTARQAAGVAFVTAAVTAIGVLLLIGGLALTFLLDRSGYTALSVVAFVLMVGALVGYCAWVAIVWDKVADARAEARRAADREYADHQIVDRKRRP